MGTSNGFMTVDEVAQWRRLIWGMDKTPEKIANIN
jgi:ribokinase